MRTIQGLVVAPVWLVVGASCATTDAPVQWQGEWGAEACPEGTQFHRSEKYWQEFATWPAQWCTLPGGTKHGPWIEWFEDGHIRRMGFYVNGVPEGHWVVWKKPGWWKLWGADDYERIDLEYSGGSLIRSNRAG